MIVALRDFNGFKKGEPISEDKIPAEKVNLYVKYKFVAVKKNKKKATKKSDKK